MELTSSGPFHDFGSFVLRKEALHPQQHPAFRGIIYRIVEEFHPDSGLLNFLQHQALVHDLAGQPVWGVKDYDIHLGDSEGIAESIESRPI